jgi:glycosyltransferase involved in cell wall biosynthesis
VEKKKQRIFLYAHINHIGAFNLSALHLAQHLDKRRFEIFTLTLARGDLDFKGLVGVNTFKCFYPAKISNYLGILWGVFNADVVFVMRGNNYRFVRLCTKVLNKKSFKRQGNKIDNSVLGAISSAVGGEKNIAESYNFCNEVFSPNKLIGEYNLNRWGVKFNSRTFLPPFINTSGFTKKRKISKEVRSVVFIGNDMLRKNIEFYCHLAYSFPELNFNVIGKAPNKEYFSDVVNNLMYRGAMSPLELNEFLEQVDLHCFTSRSEGFGKVTIEVAAKGIPSILFADYGAEEWLANGLEGIVVQTDEDYIQALEALIQEPEKFKLLQNGLNTLVERFSMKNQIEQYEKVIEDLYAS